jgi:hypothetical protein
VKRLHGKHNKNVCDKLHLQDVYKCNDWVVTISFYSSIHYFDHALFPFKYNDTTEFKDINDAHRFLKSNNRHHARGLLVQMKYPELAGAYTFLKAESHTARYVNYNINQAIANQAYQKLENIIKIFDRDKKDIK